MKKGALSFLMALTMLSPPGLHGEEAKANAEKSGKTAAEAVVLDDETQLWFDDSLVDKALTHGVTRQVNGPEKIERVLKPEMPWEALGFIFYSSVVMVDSRSFLLYYGTYDAEKKKHFCVATSEDGLKWERPKLGLREFGGNKDNNILAVDAVEACVIDERRAKPGAGFRLFYTRHWPDPERAGVYTATSQDGIHWKEMEERMLPFVPDSQPSAFWDDATREYLIYLRAWDKKRCVAQAAVTEVEKPWPYTDMGHPYHVWGRDKIPTLSDELPIVMRPDAKDPPTVELYTSVCLKYDDQAYLAFPAAFTLYKGPEFEKRALPKTSDGPFEVQMAVSRNGLNWERFRQPYLPAGTYDGVKLELVSMGVGMVHPMPRHANDVRLLQYFVGWPYTHGMPVVWDRDPAERQKWMKQERGGIYCATQRLDGFVSMDAGKEEGTLVTKAVKLTDKRLFVNVKTGPGGGVKVALLDLDGHPWPGFGADTCELIRGDELHREVKWKGQSPDSFPQNEPLCVQFTMRNAKLFSWECAGSARMRWLSKPR